MTRAYNTATTQQNSGGAVSGVTAGKNGVLNGAFDIWQRGTSVSGAGGGAYTADRWFIYAGSNGTVSRQSTSDTTNLPGIQYCARVGRLNGVTDATGLPFIQSFETANSIPYRGKVLTISFYARRGANYSSASNNLTCYFVTGTGTDQNQVNYTGSIVEATNTVALTTTWQRFSFNVTCPSTINELALQFFYQPIGTAGAADYYEITGVQLEVGSVATPFSRAGGTIAGELAACQRYYFRNQNPLVTNAQIGGIGFTFSSTAGVNSIPLPVAMRVVPTSLDYSGLRPYDITAGSVLTVTSASIAGDSTQTTGTYTYVLSSGTANRMIRIDASATTGYIGFSAEL